MDAPDSRSCPFCGHKSHGVQAVQLVSGESGAVVACSECGARGPEQSCPEVAVFAWNQREGRLWLVPPSDAKA